MQQIVGLRAESLEEKMELLVNLKALMRETPIPYFINATVLRLLEVFRHKFVFIFPQTLCFYSSRFCFIGTVYAHISSIKMNDSSVIYRKCWHVQRSFPFILREGEWNLKPNSKCKNV